MGVLLRDDAYSAGSMRLNERAIRGQPCSLGSGQANKKEVRPTRAFLVLSDDGHRQDDEANMRTGGNLNSVIEYSIIEYRQKEPRRQGRSNSVC